MFQKIKAFLLTNQTTRQTVTKNTFWLFGGEIIGRLLRTLLIIYAARILGTEGWGVFSYAISLVGLFMIFSDIGLSQLVTREASRNDPEKNKYISTAFYLKLTLLILSFITVIIIAPFVSKIAGTKPILLLVALVLFFDSIREFIWALNRATQKMEREGLNKIITNALIAGLGFYFLTMSPSPKMLAWAYFLGSAIGTFWFIITILPLLKNIWSNFSKEKLKIIWQSAWPIAILALFSGLMFNMDMVMLGIWRTTEEIGLYAAAQRLIQIFYLLPTLLTASVFPVFARLAVEDKVRFGEVLGKVLAFIFVSGLPMVAGGIILSKDIMSFVFGNEYTSGAITFSLLVITVLLIFPGYVFNNVAYSFNAQKKLIMPVLAGTLVNIGLNSLLIPRFGIEGAAATTIVSQIIIVSCYWLITKKMLAFSIFNKILKIILAVILMSVFTYLLNRLDWHVFLNIAVSAGFYIIILILIKERTFKEVKKLINF